VHLAHIWEGLIGPMPSPPEGLENENITNVVVDSRAVGPGSLFVALRGERADGHEYLRSAFEQGAVAAIAEPRAKSIADLGATLIEIDTCGPAREDEGTRGHGEEQPVSPRPPVPVARAGKPYIFIVPDSMAALQKLAAFWRSQMPVETIGITGSVGKTTTKETVANVVAQRFATLRSEGNYNNEIGLPLTLLRLTTAHERAVLEMGMYSLGEISRLCEIARPRIGVVTNVGPTHLERMGSIERIAQAKAELVRALPTAADGGVAILNADDPLVLAMANQTQARVITYGLSEEADLRADEVTSEGLEGIRFRLHYDDQAYHVHLPMLGRHSVHTALRGSAAGLAEGLSWQEIINGLQDVSGQLRLLVVPGLRGATLIDDTYNASPASMLAALNLMEDIANSKHRSVAVLGDMLELGAYEEDGHRVVGGRAARVVNKLVTVGHRARWIAGAAIAAGMDPADVYPTETNRDALAVLQGLVRPGDIILIKGSRGQAMESIVDALSRPRETKS
jgi:UDP-N-acetylmuramoyl-tripeptide--D-alanyl-D-alanine ligase